MTNAPDTTKSRALFDRALNALPGGVSSPVRAFGAVDGTPIFVKEAKGAQFTDADGNQYLDFVQSWGPLILGHAHSAIVDAVSEAAARGLSYGAPHENELLLAERVAKCYPGVERVRFTSSGTEATMSALRLARGVTDRDRIVKFNGCYHGHSDGLLVAAGSGAITFGEPSSAGVPKAVAELTTVLPLDDIEALEACFAAQGSEIACVIIEPIPANNGLLFQRPEFLQRLREITKEHGTLLIFDEVISGFRVGRGGAAELYDITPDLVTFGKIIGGGMPVGAFAGAAPYFDKLAPNGPVYQAGTLSGNPVAMAAGLANLDELENNNAWQYLETLGKRLEDGITQILAGHDWPVCFLRQGSIFWFSFGDKNQPRHADAIAASAAELYRTFHATCLQQGIYIAPSAYEVGFLSTAHMEADVDRAIEAFGVALTKTLQ